MQIKPLFALIQWWLQNKCLHTSDNTSSCNTTRRASTIKYSLPLCAYDRTYQCYFTHISFISNILVSKVFHITPCVKCLNSEFNKDESVIAKVEKKTLSISVQYVAVIIQAGLLSPYGVMCHFAGGQPTQMMNWLLSSGDEQFNCHFGCTGEQMMQIKPLFNLI